MKKQELVTTTIFDREMPTALLHKLFRERYLKISQSQLAQLTGLKQPNIATHESGDPYRYLDSVADAYRSVGFDMWASRVATSLEEAEMLSDLIDPESGSQYLTTEQMKAIEIAETA